MSVSPHTGGKSQHKSSDNSETLLISSENLELTAESYCQRLVKGLTHTLLHLDPEKEPLEDTVCLLEIFSIFYVFPIFQGSKNIYFC